MNLFRINNGLNGTGEILNNVNNITWVERYLEAGEFTIKCPATEYFRTKFIPGSFISHVDTDEVMMVETQIIDETKDGVLQLEVSGRSIEAIIMENRTINEYTGTPFSFFLDGSTIKTYRDPNVNINASSDGSILLKPYTWVVAKYIINKYCVYNTTGTAGQILQNEGVTNLQYEEILSPLYDMYPNVDIEKNRYRFKLTSLDNVYSKVKELLGTTDSGVKGIRVMAPNSNGTNVFKIQVHQGTARVGGSMAEAVTFSINTGDLESVRYLWQFNPIIRTHISSNYFGYPFPSIYMEAPATYPTGIPSGSYRWGVKVIGQDAGDLTEYYSETPSLAELVDVYDVLKLNSDAVMYNEKKMTIIDAKVSKNAKYKYKKDYNIGDLVYVSGNYDAATVMRVTEHAYVLDETGESSIPTLSPW